MQKKSAEINLALFQEFNVSKIHSNQFKKSNSIQKYFGLLCDNILSRQKLSDILLDRFNVILSSINCLLKRILFTSGSTPNSIHHDLVDFMFAKIVIVQQMGNHSRHLFFTFILDKEPATIGPIECDMILLKRLSGNLVRRLVNRNCNRIFGLLFFIQCGKVLLLFFHIPNKIQQIQSRLLNFNQFRLEINSLLKIIFHRCNFQLQNIFLFLNLLCRNQNLQIIPSHGVEIHSIHSFLMVWIRELVSALLMNKIYSKQLSPSTNFYKKIQTLI